MRSSPTPARIHITGNAGSGKTTLAIALGQQLDIPVFHLDSIVWQPHWKKTPPQQRQQLEAAMCEPKTWIIEGVSEQVRQLADRVLVLDTPPWQCLARAGKRNLPYAFRSRPGLPAHCPEILILPKLLRIIARFNSTIRADIARESSTETKYRWLGANTTAREAQEQLQ